jgi:hypothetical protein
MNSDYNTYVNHEICIKKQGIIGAGKIGTWMVDQNSKPRPPLRSRRSSNISAVYSAPKEKQIKGKMDPALLVSRTMEQWNSQYLIRIKRDFTRKLRVSEVRIETGKDDLSGPDRWESVYSFRWTSLRESSTPLGRSLHKRFPSIHWPRAGVLQGPMDSARLSEEQKVDRVILAQDMLQWCRTWVRNSESA